MNLKTLEINECIVLGQGLKVAKGVDKRTLNNHLIKQLCRCMDGIDMSDIMFSDVDEEIKEAILEFQNKLANIEIKHLSRYL